MLPPHADLEARRPIWDAMQMLWMDTDPACELERIAAICASSKYSVAELEQIYWNEVRPAVKANLHSFNPAPEWAGLEIGWLADRILSKHRFGRKLPVRWFRRDSSTWWHRLAERIGELRSSR